MARQSVSIEESKRPIFPLSSPRKKPVAEENTISPPEPQKPIEAEPVVFDQDLENVVIVNKSTIKLDRQIYSRRGFNQVVGVEFEELSKKEDTFSPTQFFQLYDSLFFDIPKTGKISHASLVRRSKEYISGFEQIDPKDSIIDSLNDKIIELEQQLLLTNQADPEHPFFKNGTLLAESVNGSRTGKFFYMDKGYKREVAYNPTFYGTLLKVLGYTSGDDYPEASRNMLSQIKTGPILSEGNFEQPTYIEEGELIIGTNVSDNTKDATISRLRSEVSSLTQRVEDLQSLLDEANTGPINQGGGVDTGGAFNDEPTFGGQFGPNFNNPFN
jgi:hypothetical protein